MTIAPPSDQLAVGAPERRRPARRTGRAPGRTPIGYVFVSLYAILALAFGIFPALYAVFLAFTNADGGFAGLGNFVQVVTDFRFWPAVLHVVAYLVIWLLALLIFVVLLALVVHALRELVEALDRRVAQVERLGEARIAGEATALRKKAVNRIRELTNSASDRDTREAERSGGVMTDDGGPLRKNE